MEKWKKINMSSTWVRCMGVCVCSNTHSVEWSTQQKIVFLVQIIQMVCLKTTNPFPMGEYLRIKLNVDFYHLNICQLLCNTWVSRDPITTQPFLSNVENACVIRRRWEPETLPGTWQSVNLKTQNDMHKTHVNVMFLKWMQLETEHVQNHWNN